MKKQTLDRILQSQGFGTRKGCQQLINDGDVLVNGEPASGYKLPLDPTGMVLTVFDEEWPVREHVYLVLNKPSNIECSRKPSHHPGVHTLLPEQFLWRDVQPVGRLDHDTTGMLLLSDDGAFIHTQGHPKHHQNKVYVATLKHEVDESLVAQLLDGVQLIDEPAPIAALAARLIDPLHVEMTLDQGKYHQVKRMLAAAGNRCEALVRSQIGGLTLASLGLAEGEWCYLDDEMLARLNQNDAA
ncbi:pseudouridine synthase [Jeongeupia naejangsanensis]|uniref:Ribosomal small subunit pseudouridine synthase A n=1 Tax=Jeongeupia naejangsanensis TaxID=613195 RepID=A0ABS2BJZ8_9NEIS|nr:pseudouridine synthase [Jeongeupia naejangsanensis]MBM3115750.1 pseudouridine synthase [Jeongeupia naejangsanensis]